MSVMTRETDNCSTIIIGKKASRTGKVLLAHNEDDPRNIVQIHRVPRVRHKKGETVSFPDAGGIIPEIAETLSYDWLECRELGGDPFGDSFINECGVAIVSNGTVDSRVPADGRFAGGIGYGMRRLVAERAHSAREGVEILAGLMRDHGYYSARSYAICDSEEGWVVQLTKGNQFAARRVGDDEIFYIPNWYNIHTIDFHDDRHRNFYWSEDLVPYAIANGWYSPKKKDFSDFDFAAVYQAGGVDIPSNRLRSDLAWKHLLNGRPLPYRSFSVKAPRKFGVEDLKAIMRLHYEGLEADRKKDPRMSPHRYGICRDTTILSLIVEFNAVKELTCSWMAFPRPCIAPYVPWYLGSTEIPKGYNWMGWKDAQASHFAVDENEFEYHGGRAIASFRLLQNIMEFDYPFCEKIVSSDIAAMEKEWSLTRKAIDRAYLDLARRNHSAALALLTDYTGAQAAKSWTWAREASRRLADAKDAENMKYWRSRL